MNWLKENWFKFSVLIVIIFLAVFAANFYVHSSTIKNKLENSTKCQQVALKLFDDENKQASENNQNSISGKTYLKNPQFHFSNKSYKCLYYVESIIYWPQAKITDYDYTIKDVYENKILISHRIQYIDDKKTESDTMSGIESIEEFNGIKDKIFKE